MIHLTGQYQLEDFKAAQRLHAWGSRSGPWVTYLILGAFIVAGFGLLVAGLVPRYAETYGSLVFIAVVLIIFGFLGIFRNARQWPRQLERIFDQQKDLHAPFEIELDEEGWHWRNEYGQTRIPWGDFVKWKQGEDILILYRSDVMFHFLPRRLFHDQGEVDYVLEQLRAHNVPSARQAQGPWWKSRAWLWLLIPCGVILLCTVMSSCGSLFFALLSTR